MYDRGGQPDGKLDSRWQKAEIKLQFQYAMRTKCLLVSVLAFNVQHATFNLMLAIVCG